MKQLTLALALLLLPSLAIAGVVDNSQGTGNAPLSVTTAVQVIPYNGARYEWCIEPETVAIRCRLSSGTSAAASPAPSSTVGFFIPAASTFCERLGNQANGNIGNPVARVDCASTGGATNVDTFEENGSSP